MQQNIRKHDCHRHSSNSNTPPHIEQNKDSVYSPKVNNILMAFQKDRIETIVKPEIMLFQRGWEYVNIISALGVDKDNVKFPVYCGHEGGFLFKQMEFDNRNMTDCLVAAK